MANFLKQNNPSPKNSYEQRYTQARGNLLLVVVFTAINLIFLVTNADTYFLFSAFIPYFITVIGMLLCGRFPADYYTDELSGDFLDNTFFFVLVAISVVLTLLYLLAWALSKKKVGWLIFALVFFCLDTAGMLLLNGIALDSILDIVFHIWVIISLILGIYCHKKQKNLPPEEIAPAEGITEAGCLTQSPVLKIADPDEKHRVLLETQVMNYTICYRRVKHTNELVINGNVYDVFEGIVEPAHTLTAVIDGHCIEAGYNGLHSIISFDGEVKAKKLRLY